VKEPEASRRPECRDRHLGLLPATPLWGSRLRRIRTRGDRKRGALGDSQYLVAYLLDEKARAVTFLDIGQHEYFYCDLEKHLKNHQVMSAWQRFTQIRATIYLPHPVYPA
jgi:hypothetical protein